MDRIVKDKEEEVIDGVIAGISKRYDWDPTVVRIVWLILFFGTPLPMGWLYIILMIILPEEN